MCGIAGAYRASGRRVSATALEAASELLRARGPDAQGLWLSADASVGLVHRRLAIIDLEARSNQPFSDATGRYRLTYNGEVYNFRELRTELEALGHAMRTTSDTEVVLHALMQWDVAALARFNGMFALAFWDDREKTLLLARDRVGVKPLYVLREANGDVAFASTLIPLAHVAERRFNLDAEATGEYLQGLYFPHQRSALQGVRQLAPGHYARAGAAGRWEERRWWAPPLPAESVPTPDRAGFSASVESALAAAVQRRLVSDVPVGVWLSGGIDSSLIASFMAEASAAPVRSFTIRFEDPRFDESAAARAIAQRLGTRHEELEARPADLLALIHEHAGHYDEPFADASALPTTLLSFLTRRHVTVALCGDGGDELFGGYHYYRLARLFRRLEAVPRAARSALGALGRNLPGRAGMGLHALALPDWAARHAYVRSASKFTDWARLLRVPGDARPARIRAGALACPGGDAARQVMAADFSTYLPDDLLTKGDRASMAASLENRHPFLDVNVVELALSQPAALVPGAGESKWVLRELAARRIGADIARAPKRGFAVPIRHWFRNELRDFVIDNLNVQSLAHDPVVNGHYATRLRDEHLSGRRDHEGLLWALLAYRQWLGRNAAVLSA